MSLTCISLARYLSIFHVSLTTYIEEDLVVRIVNVVNGALNAYFLLVYVALPGEFNNQFKICQGESMNEKNSSQKVTSDGHKIAILNQKSQGQIRRSDNNVVDFCKDLNGQA